MNRDGTVVIRPDSGDPVEVICGIPYYSKCKLDSLIGNYDYSVTLPKLAKIEGKYFPVRFNRFPDGVISDWVFDEFSQIPEHEVKGLIECLWDTFGGTVTEQGYKLLDSHIGAIYGDSITLERQQQIIDRLIEKGFVPSVVLGIGSYSYQMVTRDTHGSAVKATCVQKGEGNYEVIFKDPKTDKSKKSAKGLLKVVKDINNNFKLLSDVSKEEEASDDNELKTVFVNGELIRKTSLNEIRELLSK